MTQRIPMTPAGRDKLRAELRRIREIERPQNVQDIETAREHGDLSENAEYHAAKERQGFLDARLRELEDKLARAEVIDPASLSGARIVFGATVTLEDIDEGAEKVYAIVGEDEADARHGRISVSSPLARALIGKEEGDVVQVRTPGGIREYEVVDVVFSALD